MDPSKFCVLNCLKHVTRLSSIESQPKKVVVVVCFFVVIIVDHKNLTLKFAQNWGNNKVIQAGAE